MLLDGDHCLISKLSFVPKVNAVVKILLEYLHIFDSRYDGAVAMYGLS